jgi:hypothetical protein
MWRIIETKIQNFSTENKEKLKEDIHFLQMSRSRIEFERGKLKKVN